jgi:DNA-binding transcriptional MocR family regulator
MALDRRGNTLCCSWFSKTFAPDYRMGWIATGRHMSKVLLGKGICFVPGDVFSATWHR